jgi:trans-2,3-dihydro-3-hydroxyanthranilate isomerase
MLPIYTPIKTSTMRTYPYRLVNVFAESIFGGNPLCVFESAANLTDVEMQGLALQFNLSETTFLFPSDCASAGVRIFTPTFEMPFAGHPTLGSAHVVRELFKMGDAISLEMKVGLIPVAAMGDVWTLSANAPTYREMDHPKAELAAMLGLVTADILDGARWVNTGSEQLIVPLASPDAVRRASPKAELLKSINSVAGRSMAYVFAANGAGKLLSRFFFMKHDAIVEDPGTGSATANLGGWFVGQNAVLPLEYKIEQGEAVNRACHLGLRVDTNRHIFVSGRVIEIGRGVLTLP